MARWCVPASRKHQDQLYRSQLHHRCEREGIVHSEDLLVPSNDQTSLVPLDVPVPFGLCLVDPLVVQNMCTLRWYYNCPNIVRLQGIHILGHCDLPLLAVNTVDGFPIVLWVLHHDRIDHIVLFNRFLGRSLFNFSLARGPCTMLLPRPTRSSSFTAFHGSFLDTTLWCCIHLVVAG